MDASAWTNVAHAPAQDDEQALRERVTRFRFV
jgi:hypothetical protein